MKKGDYMWLRAYANFQFEKFHSNCQYFWVLFRKLVLKKPEIAVPVTRAKWWNQQAEETNSKRFDLFFKKLIIEIFLDLDLDPSRMARLIST